MAQLISEIWAGLREAGLPEVMLYLPDHSASRCHWDDTVLIGEVRVALVADQERKIVRILPVDSCAGIGIASPKGTDPSGYKSLINIKLRQRFAQPGELPPEVVEPDDGHDAHDATPPPAPAPTAYVAPEPLPEPVPAAKLDPLVSRWGMTPKPTTRYGGTPNGHR